MDRRQRAELDRRFEQARRLALESSDPPTRERLAQLIEDLELQLLDQRKVAPVRVRHRVVVYGLPSNCNKRIWEARIAAIEPF
jgi:hypothetical protein